MRYSIMPDLRLFALGLFLSAALMLHGCAAQSRSAWNDDDAGQVLRGQFSKSARLQVNLSGSWAAYSGDSPGSINYDAPFLTGQGQGLHDLPACANARFYVLLQSGADRVLLAERQLPMAGGYNFRDLGGIKARDGKRVAWGRFFRADEMDKLSKDDLAYLSGIPIITVVDFRTGQEADAAPDRLPGSVKNAVPLRISPGNMSLESVRNIKTAEEMEALLVRMYRHMVSDEEVIRLYREFFRILQDDNNLPVLYHCSAGKDRTGLATALILSSLGVPRSTVFAEYLSSNDYLSLKYGEIIENNPHMEPALTVRREYLKAAYDEIEKKHGSVETYLKDVLRVDIALMRQKHLY